MIPHTLSDFHGDSKPSGDQTNFKHCPMCGNHSWKVFVDPIRGKWVCFGGQHPLNPLGGPGGGNLTVEGEGTSGAHILDLLRDDVPTEWGEIELPEWEPLSSTAKLYLKRRGVSPEEARSLGLVERTDKFRILIPYFDRAGQMVYYNTRRYSDKFGEGPKYLTAPGRHPLFTCPNLPRPMFLAKVEGELWDPSYPRHTPTIVEGVFDAVAVTRAGYKGIGLGGKSLPRYLVDSLLTEVRGYGTIYVLLDRDALPQALRIRDLLTSKPGIADVQVRVCPDNKDPGDMTPEEIREALR